MTKRSFDNPAFTADEQRLEQIQSTLTRSAQVASDVDKILQSFQLRLTDLEELLRPIEHDVSYHARIHENIEHTLLSVNRLLEKFDVLADVEAVLRRATLEQLDVFLTKLDQLSKAEQFFAEHERSFRSAKDARERIAKSHEKHMQKCADFFDRILSKYSSSVDLTTPDPPNTITWIPPAAVDDLRRLAERLQRAGLSGYTKAYKTQRAHALEITFKNYMRRFVPTHFGLEEGNRVPLANQATSGKGHNQSSSSASSGSAAQSHPSSSSSTSAASANGNGNAGSTQTRYEKGTHVLLKVTRLVLRMLEGEKQLATQLLGTASNGGSPTFSKPCAVVYGQTIHEVLKSYTATLDEFLTYAKNGRDSESVYVVFDMVECLDSLHDKFADVLAGDAANLDRFGLMATAYTTVGGDFLKRMVSQLGAVTVKLPPDGTVHEVTSKSMNFLKRILDFRSAIDVICSSRKGLLHLNLGSTSGGAVGNAAGSNPHGGAGGGGSGGGVSGLTGQSLLNPSTGQINWNAAIVQDMLLDDNDDASSMHPSEAFDLKKSMSFLRPSPSALTFSLGAGANEKGHSGSSPGSSGPGSSSSEEEDLAMISLVAFVARVLLKLDRYLGLVSRQYKKAVLGHLFLINNRHYIARQIRTSGLQAVVDASFLEVYDVRINKDREAYMQAAWAKARRYLLDDDNAPVTPKNMKKELKGRFAGFNGVLVEQCEKQRAYAIPDSELRSQMKKSIIDAIVPPYEKMLAKYRSMPFTKHPEKYIVYDAPTVASMLRGLFDETKIKL
jgi:hypothetical protein